MGPDSDRCTTANYILTESNMTSSNSNPQPPETTETTQTNQTTQTAEATQTQTPTEPPPSYTKLAMRNMVRKRGRALRHFILTTIGLLGVLIGLSYLTR